MLSIILTGLCIGVISGAIGTVYILVLGREEAFNFWWRFGNRFEGKWFFRPIWSCSKCFSGQFALWFYLFKTITIPKINSLPGLGIITGLKVTFERYSLIEHLFSVSIGILAAIYFSQTIKTKNQNEQQQ